jgi:hypothetical protein
MKVGTIPITKKGYWICTLSTDFPDFIFNEFFLELSHEEYTSLLIIRSKIEHVSPGEDAMIKTAIKLLPCISEFECINTTVNSLAYRLTIDDTQGETSPARVLSRIENVAVRKFISNPALAGIQYLNLMFTAGNEFEELEKCVVILEKEEFEVVRDDKEFCVRKMETHDRSTVFRDIFEIMGIEGESLSVLRNAVWNQGNRDTILRKNEGSILKLWKEYPVLSAAIDSVLNLFTLIERFGSVK